MLECLESESWAETGTLIVIDRFDDLQALLTLNYTYMGLCGDLLNLKSDLTIGDQSVDDFMWRKYATAHIGELKECITAVETPEIHRLHDYMGLNKEVSKAAEADQR